MRVDEASRIIGAGPDAVWRALVDPDLIATWLPPNDMTGEVEIYEVRPGGAYRMSLRYPAGSGGKSTADSDVVSGRFVEVLPPNQAISRSQGVVGRDRPEFADSPDPATTARLVQTADFVSDDPAFSGTMTMTWMLRAVSDGTEVIVRATDVPSGISPEDHAEGLAASLSNLAALFA